MFWKGMTYMGGTIGKVTSWEFQKCCSFWVLKVLNPSYWLSKLGENLRKNSEERRCQKKRHGHNFEFWALPLNQRGTNHVGPMLIQWRRSKLKIVAVSFFLNTDFGCQQNWKFEWTLEADNYGLKPLNLKNYNIFGFLMVPPYIGHTFSKNLVICVLA